jgi:Phasin protein
MSVAKGTEITRADDIAEIDGIVKADSVTETTKRADMTKDFGNQNTDITKFKPFPEQNPEYRSNVLAIAGETTNYSKTYLDKRFAFIEKLLSAKSFDTVIQIQSEYAKTSFEDFVAQSKKIGELYSNLAKLAFKPVEEAVAKSQGTKY